MSTDHTLQDVIDLPRNHSRRGTPIFTLLEQSGYFTAHDQVTEAAICTALRRRPELVNDWIELSESTRASSGWYLRRAGAQHYQVGYYPDSEPIEYDDALAACAAYIKRNIEAIRTDRHND